MRYNEVGDKYNYNRIMIIKIKMGGVMVMRMIYG